MLELIQTGGLMMWPIVICSVIAMAITCERFWSLRTERIIPKRLVPHVWNLYRDNQLDNARIRTLRSNSPLGEVLAAGLVNRRHGREMMKESIEDVGRKVVHDLGRFLNTLGTVATVTPLLGMLGTVIGMIKVFAAITNVGVGDPSVLAGGISEALVSTAAGLSVAIPSLMFHRYFQGHVLRLVVKMEDEARKLVEVMHGEREVESK